MTNAASPPRDRDQTQARLLDAAEAILLESGPAELGVNAIARRAGCDKQLIYRYFNGLDGLLSALGEDLGQRLSGSLRARVATPPQDYADLVETLILALFDLALDEPLWPRLRAAELGPAASLAPLARARGAVLAEFVASIRRQAPPAGLDAPAMNALVIGMVEMAALQASQGAPLAGLDLAAPEGRQRARNALRRLVRSAYRGEGG